MSPPDLHPVICLLLAGVMAFMAYAASIAAVVFWRDPTTWHLRVMAGGFALVAAFTGWLAVLYAVAGLYPLLAFLYGWLVL